MSFIPYQIDHTVTNVSKMVGFSKKKVSFKFGFANRQAVQEGLAGAQCRGSEHELTFVWSLSSGKRQLFLDGKDVHFSESGQNGWTNDRAWQHAFTMKDPTGIYRIHFLSQPKNADIPDSRPFDIRVAGVSYFSFNQIFQLGTPSMTVRQNGGRDDPAHRRDSPMSPEERRQIAAAKVESLRDIRERKVDHHASPPKQKAPTRAPAPPPPPPKVETNLLSFDDDPPPPQQQQPPQMLSQSVNAMQSPYANQFASYPQPGQQQQQQPYGQPPSDFSQTMSSLPYGQPPSDFSQSVSSLPYGQQPQQPQPMYGQTPQLGYGQQPAPPPPPPQQSFESYNPSSSMSALTQYQAPAGQPAPSPYAMPPQQQQQQQQQAPPPFGGGLQQQQSASLNAAGFQQQLGSPEGQSYASYGSAPSFAQPPRQAPPPPPPGGPMMSSYSAPVPAQAPGGYPMQQLQQPPPPPQQQFQQQQQQQPGPGFSASMGGMAYGGAPYAPAPGYPNQQQPYNNY